MEKIRAYILSGGKSSRFGSDKARAVVNGRPMLAHVADCVMPLATSVTVVAEAQDKYGDLGYKTIQDLQPGKGPLAGLEAAIADQCNEGWFFLLSCDWVGLRTDWLRTLCELCAPGLQAVAFKGEKNIEPLFAVYHTSIGPNVTERLKAGRLSICGLVADLPHATAPLPDDWHTAVQANRPEDIERKS